MGYIYCGERERELAHAILGAENSHDLPPASWRPRRACGVIQSESGGSPENQVG